MKFSDEEQSSGEIRFSEQLGLSEEKIKQYREELQWVDVTKYSNRNRSDSFLNYLIPAGALITAGVLVRGLYLLQTRQSKGQQQMMRYRILAQGITAGLAAIGMLTVKFSSSP